MVSPIHGKWMAQQRWLVDWQGVFISFLLPVAIVFAGGGIFSVLTAKYWIQVSGFGLSTYTRHRLENILPNELTQSWMRCILGSWKESSTPKILFHCSTDSVELLWKKYSKVRKCSVLMISKTLLGGGVGRFAYFPTEPEGFVIRWNLWSPSESSCSLCQPYTNQNNSAGSDNTIQR